jgi:hypothetical protein
LNLHPFTSDRQQRVFNGVLTELGRLEYTGELLQQAYDFNDWFSPDAPARHVAAVGFGRKPFGYDSACVAAFFSTPNPRQTLAGLRALGAPFAIEIREDEIIPWSVGLDDTTTHQSAAGRIPADAMRRFFDVIKAKWNPDAVLRAKNIGQSVGPTEIDWVDLGLIPALENEISRKLDRMLKSALHDAQRVHKERTGQKPESEELYRLVFRLLAGKVFHDRKVGGFDKIDGANEPQAILAEVSKYYKEPQNYLRGREEQLAAAAQLWNRFSFQNLSVDVLAFIAENTLIDKQIRKDGGIHSTPHRIARYVVEHLPWGEIPQNERIVFEPCSGHGVFLVAALKRLRDLLGAGWSNRDRHNYLVRMLHGFEREPFSREVSKLCLMLADFPNPNGWRLEVDDIFSSRSKFVDALSNARVLLCNPPFEDFKTAERQKYGSRIAPQKPLELLRRILGHARRDVMMGLVLPQQFLKGVSYRGVREELARRYREIDLVALPDKVFTHAEMETVLVLAHGAKLSEQPTSVNFAEVRQRELKSFKASGLVSRQDRGSFSPTAAANELWVSVLQEVWERLQHLPKLGQIAEIHRGVEWQPPFDEAKYISTKPRKGFVRGLRNVEEGFLAYELPEQAYLNAEPEFQRGGAWQLSWSKPKAIVNAARKARGSWRLACVSDETGLVCTQRFHCLWPKSGWTAKVLSAVLNSPLVSAFVASREGNRDIRKTTLEDCPIPSLAPSDMATLERYVDDLTATLSEQPESKLPLRGGDSWEERARNILLQIDALVLRAYNLPPWIERKLLEFFRDEKRPVQFEFGDYYPKDYGPTLPLWLYVSPNFANCRGSHILQTIPKFEDPVMTEALEEVS